MVYLMDFWMVMSTCILLGMGQYCYNMWKDPDTSECTRLDFRNLFLVCIGIALFLSGMYLLHWRDIVAANVATWS